MEPIKTAIIVPIAEETHIAAARRATAELCRQLDVAPAILARAELIAVELARNILHHAERGHLYLCPDLQQSGLHLVASDRGPGVGDLERAMTPGYSTRGTPGLGLGVIQRQADSFDLYSWPGQGTIATALVTAGPPATSPASILSTHIDGETLNGDSWAIFHRAGNTVFLLVDGLGHGHHAAIAAETALRVAATALEQNPFLPLTALVERMDQPMRATRGAAVLLLEIGAGSLTCCGIGNISAVITSADDTTRSLVSHNGTVGHRMTRVQQFEYTFKPGSLLVAHTDGLSTRWKLAQYPGIHRHAPATIAGLLYRDAVRGRDDATVLVAPLDVLSTDAHTYGAASISRPSGAGTRFDASNR